MKAIKIVIDCVMTVVFALLLRLSNTGLLWHEIVGLTLLGVVGVHLLLNFRQIGGLFKSFFKKNIKAKILLTSDVVLIVFFILTILSGILVSEALFPGLGFSTPDLVIFHTSIPYVTLIVAGVHLGLHLPSIMAAFRRMFRNARESVLRKRILSAVGLAVFLAGFVLTLDADLASRLAPLPEASPSAKEKSVLTTASRYFSETPSAVVTVAQDASTPTLEDFLGSMHCTACRKNCSLLAPQCSKGVRQAQQAEASYENTYGASLREDSEGSEERQIPGLFAVDDTSGGTPQIVQEEVPLSAAGSADVARNLTQGLGIIAFFTGASYYLMKLFSLRRKPKSAPKSTPRHIG